MPAVTVLPATAGADASADASADAGGGASSSSSAAAAAAAAAADDGEAVLIYEGWRLWLRPGSLYHRRTRGADAAKRAASAEADILAATVCEPLGFPKLFELVVG